MLVVVIGSPASASTWAFNAVRAMLALTRPGAVSVYAETGAELLNSFPVGCKDVVLKSHLLDADLLKILACGQARIIMTDRDPHDCAVSQSERFGLKPNDIVRQLTQAYTSMAMVLAVLEPLRLRYEDRFFADSRSLRRIAEWLGSTVPDCELQRIFEALEAKVVTPRLRSWADELMAAGAAPAAFAEHHDHATQLHPNHIGDGKIGKGRERLPAERFTILSDCLAGFGLEDQWRTRTIKWSGALFRYADDREPQACERLDACGEERLLVYGPYLYLPTGYWRIVPLIQAAYPDVPVQLVADVYTDRRGVLQLRVVTLPACNPHRITLEFEHLNHLDPIEVRLSSVRDGNRTQVIFSGVELRWLGPLDPQPGHSARGVNDRGLLSHPPG